MADNKQFLDRSGTPFTSATRQDGGVDYSRVVPRVDEGGTLFDVGTAHPMPVVQTGAPALPTGAASETTLAAIAGYVDGVETKLDAVLTELGQKYESGGALPLPTGAAADGTDITG